MSTRTIARSSAELDRAIDALASAGDTLQLTPFERFSYRALMISADSAVVLFLIHTLVVVPMLAAGALDLDEFPKVLAYMVLGIEFIYYLAILLGVISLALNIPLFRKASRDRAKLKATGLSSLSYSLWRESRRSRWINRIRTILWVVVALLNVGSLGAVLLGYFNKEAPDSSDLVVVYAMLTLTLFVVALLSSARYLRHQRERIELSANADKLRSALRSLRERAGGQDVPVLVPVDLLERTAKIELAKIAAERKDAALESIAFRSNAYAITFDPNAASLRAGLGSDDRVELEDLVAQLSTEGSQLPKQVEGTKLVPLRYRTKSNRVVIDCLIDRETRGIRIVGVHHEAAPISSARGATYA